MLCTATPDVSSSSENINIAVRVSKLSFRFLWLWFNVFIHIFYIFETIFVLTWDMGYPDMVFLEYLQQFYVELPATLPQSLLIKFEIHVQVSKFHGHCCSVFVKVKGDSRFCLYTGEYGPVKTCILGCFIQWWRALQQ